MQLPLMGVLLGVVGVYPDRHHPLARCGVLPTGV